MGCQEIFENISVELGVKKATKPANQQLAKLVYWEEKIRSLITGSRPILTKEMLISANPNVRYSNKKIKEAISFEFTLIEKAIENASAFCKKEII